MREKWTYVFVYKCFIVEVAGNGPGGPASGQFSGRSDTVRGQPLLESGRKNESLQGGGCLLWCFMPLGAEFNEVGIPGERELGQQAGPAIYCG